MAKEIADSKLLDTWGSSGTKIEPDISKIIEGWQLGEQPPHEYMNWLQNTFGSKLNHILKNGVASWNVETEYLSGATVQHNGNVWICKTTNTNSEPTDVNNNWRNISSFENLALTVDTIDDFPTGISTGNTCIVKDLDRGGIFIYDSTKVVESNNGTNFNGWIRQFSGAVNVKWFGAKGDGVTGDTVAIQNALNLGLEIDFEAKTYKCTDTLTFKSKVNGNGALFKFYGTTIDTLCFKNIEADIDNIYIDGENVTNCKYGFFNDAEYEPKCETYDGIKVSNIKHSSQPSMGIVVYRSSSSSFTKGNFISKKCEAKDINGTGVGKGIIFSFNNSSKSNILIDSPIIDTVTPVTDADAIHITTANYSSNLTSDNTFGALIINSNIKSSTAMKRGIKIQYPNTKVLSNIVNGDNILIGYDTYGFNTIFDGNTYIQTNTSGGEAYNVHQEGCIIDNALIDMSSSGIPIRIVGSPSTKLNNITLKYRGTPGGDTSGMITIQGDSTDCIFSKINSQCDNSGGTSIQIEGNSSAILSDSVMKGNKIGVRNNYCTGYMRINDSLIESSESGFMSFGTLGFKFNLSNSRVIAPIGIYNYSTGNYSQINIDNAEIECTLNGILGSANDVIKNSYIKNTGTRKGIGILGASGFKADGNITENFTTGIQYTYSTNTIVSNNVAISCTTPILKTGSTDFVFTDNFSR